jgi:hypothetical protein
MERAMVKKPEEHAGSGLDKPSAKTLTEKIGDGFRKIVPERSSQKKEPEVAPTIIPPAD